MAIYPLYYQKEKKEKKNILENIWLWHMGYHQEEAYEWHGTAPVSSSYYTCSCSLRKLIKNNPSTESYVNFSEFLMKWDSGPSQWRKEERRVCPNAQWGEEREEEDVDSMCIWIKFGWRWMWTGNGVGSSLLGFRCSHMTVEVVVAT